MEDALRVVELGADAIGFVFAESPRKISPDKALEIMTELPLFVRTVGVFTAEDGFVKEIAERVRLDYVQLHGDQSEEFASQFGSERIIRALRVRNEESLQRLDEWREAAAYLLDTWTPDKHGGTGAVFNWDLAQKAKDSGTPIILAGGLSPTNIIDAIRTVRPYAVDVSSGVELEPGIKDYSKVEEFIANVRTADQNA